jgi:hypothetical protein
MDPTGYSLRIYGRHKIKYEASCQVLPTTPGKAFIHTLNGMDFYRLLRALNFQPFRDKGITTLEAAVSPGHVELLAKLLEGVAAIQVLGEVSHNGRKLRKIEIVDSLTADTA